MIDLGLDIDYGVGSFRAGSYSGFHDWRCWLAALSNITLDKMAGFTKDSPISWNKDMPFKALLYHSDCDGVIGPAACKKLASDFNRYMLIALESLNKGEDGEWMVDRYFKWREAVNAVADGDAKEIEFC